MQYNKNESSHLNDKSCKGCIWLYPDRGCVNAYCDKHANDGWFDEELEEDESNE